MAEHDPAPPARHDPAPPARLGTILRIAFAIAGITFLVIAFRETWDRSRGVLPAWPDLLAAFALILVGLVAAARGWSALLGAGGRAQRHAFYVAQLGKYIPGAVWQAAGQVSLAARAGVPLARASASFPIHALTQLAAGGTLGAVLAVIPSDLGLVARLATLGGLLPVLLLRRGWMVRALGLVKRWGSDADAVVPPQRAILAAFAWSIATLLAGGAAFALLSRSVDVLVAVFGFALAWAIGFAAVPFPAGIGVREAVLIAVAGPAAPVIAASVVHRLVTIACEAAVILSSTRRTRARR